MRSSVKAFLKGEEKKRSARADVVVKPAAITPAPVKADVAAPAIVSANQDLQGSPAGDASGEQIHGRAESEVSNEPEFILDVPQDHAKDHAAVGFLLCPGASTVY